MAETTARTLQLLSLLQAHRVWTGPELRDRLRVSERTVRRDIDRLRDLGFPVESVSGPAGGYQLGAGANLPPLVLDDEEAVAIAVGLRTAAGGTIHGIEEASLRALAKLEQVLPPGVRTRVKAIQSTMDPVLRPWVTVDSETFVGVAQACRDHERVRFDYQDKAGVATERNVEPHHLVPRSQRWYLLAFDRDRDDWRTFRLDRLSQLWFTRQTFEPRPIPGGGPADFVEASIAAMPHAYSVEAIVHMPADELAPHVYGGATVTPIGPDRSLVRIHGDSLDWLAFQLSWFGVPFEVTEPVELVDHIATLWQRLRSAVS